MKSAEDRPRGDETELLNRANERGILVRKGAANTWRNSLGKSGMSPTLAHPLAQSSADVHLNPNGGNECTLLVKPDGVIHRLLSELIPHKRDQGIRLRRGAKLARGTLSAPPAFTLRSYLCAQSPVPPTRRQRS